VNAERWARIKSVFQDAMDRDATQRASYLDAECAADAALRGEVESLLAAHEAAGSFIEAAPALELVEAVEDPFLGKRIGPYRILAEIGRGGMGAVYRAARDDDAYRKEVALKVVQGGFASEHHRERLLQERQILAGLDHPGIARLLDGGTTGDGRPYFVMELVEGLPLDAYCQEHAPPLRRRLEIFREICAAVAYAHRNLVVHRDLKPSNILVTPEGAPKLLDFGIAKLLKPPGLGGAATVTEVRALTPYYASPEQIRGEPITTVSDVYALGLLLYLLLAGRRPFELADAAPEEALRLVCEQDPPKPSEAAPGVPGLRGDLDVITLMALRKEPARRYGSVQELSDDVRRYLEGFPVRARPDALGYRARKFVERHRAGFAAAVVALVLLVLGTVTTFMQWRRAERERSRAEQRFADVRRLANALIFEVHDEIEDLPGATRARESIVRRGLEYLDSLASEAAGDPSLQRELARGYERIGDVQGMPGESNRGDTQGALAAQSKALLIRQALARDAPSSPARVELAASHLKVGDLERVLGRSQQALANYRQALAALEGAEDVEARRHRASAQVRLGRALLADGQTPGAVTALGAAAGLFEALHAGEPANADLLHDRVVATTALGTGLVQVGRAAEAIAGYRRVLEVAESFSAAHPSDARARRDVGLVMERLGTALRDEGDLDAALALFRRCLEMDQASAEADPANFEARRDLAISHEKVGRVLLMKGDPTAAASLQETLRLRQALLAADPGNTQTQANLSTAHYWMAQAALARKDLASARRHMESSLRLEEARSAADPADLDARDSIADTSVGLADVLTQAGELDEAARVLERALRIRTELLARDPENTDRRLYLAAVHKGLGDVSQARARRQPRAEAAPVWREARRHYEQALAPLRDLLARGALTGSDAEWLQAIEGDVARCDAALGRGVPR
jgi:tetratricopeptide (TPR) repeat protein